MVYPCEDLKVKRRRRRSKQWTWEPKRYTLEIDTDHPMRRPLRTYLWRARSASDFPAASSPTTTTLPATHPATSSPTTTSPMAEGLGFTGMPYPTYGVTPAAAVPPTATAVSEPVASSSTYTGAPEPMPRRYEDGYHSAAAGMYMNGMPGYAAGKPGYTMRVPGFTSLSGLRGLSLWVEGVEDLEDPPTGP